MPSSLNPVCRGHAPSNWRASIFTASCSLTRECWPPGEIQKVVSRLGMTGAATSRLERNGKRWNRVRFPRPPQRTAGPVFKLTRRHFLHVVQMGTPSHLEER
jgi:hypothetical protein